MELVWLEGTFRTFQSKIATNVINNNHAPNTPSSNRESTEHSERNEVQRVTLGTDKWALTTKCNDFDEYQLQKNPP